MSIFGRGETPPQDNEPATETVEEIPPETPGTVSVPPFREVARGWRASLARQVKDELGSDLPARLNLVSAHPAGLARLYAERPTLLSALIRDDTDLAKASATAGTILRQAQTMIERHGSATIHLAIGSATWVEEGRKRRVPVMLRPIDVDVAEDGSISFQLRPGVEVSNGLLDMLARQGSPIEARELLEGVRGPHGFSPSAGIAMIRGVAAGIPNMEVTEDVSVGVYVHPTSTLLRELAAPQWLSLSPVTRALAGDQAAVHELNVELPPPNPSDRDPWEEKGIGDQSPRVQDVVEAASDDISLYIDVEGSYQTTLAASIAAQHARQGDQVLVVTGSPDIGEGIDAILNAEGVNDVANVIGSSRESAERTQAALKAALLNAADSMSTDLLDAERTRLRRVRESLADYTSSLHEPFPQWGVSAVDALQELTDLTSIPGGPTTTVRLSAEVLSRLSDDQGQTARELLAQASALGVFASNVEGSLWEGVRLEDPAEVEQILSALFRLCENELPSLATQIRSVAESTGLRESQSVQEWNSQLSVLSGIRESLDVFRPEIFERSAADMVLATASKQWRKDRGIHMKRSLRRRLVGQAQDYVLPGRYVSDLYEELTKVQARREMWKDFSEPNGWPRLPDSFDHVLDLSAKISADLQLLNSYLAPIYGDLFAFSIDDLEDLLGGLRSDAKGARELPARMRVLAGLEELGLGELVADFIERGVDGELLNLELDLAWWASALGLMLASEPRLGGLDPAGLQEALVEVRNLDLAQVRSLGPAVRHAVFRRRAGALATQTDAYVQASQAYRTATSAATYYARVPFSWQLMPIVITAPTLVPGIVPWGRHVDTVIMVGAERLMLAELIPIIARGRKVVVIGSETTPTAESLRAVLPTTHLDGDTRPLNDRIVQLLAKYDADQQAVAVPRGREIDEIRGVFVDGSGMPAPDSYAIETSSAEVEAVVELVAESIAANREESLVIVALNGRHQGRLTEALTHAASTDEELSRRLENGNIRVSGPEDEEEHTADHCIISIGFAKTPHGRVVHDFGAYSQPGGDQVLARMLRSAQAKVTVVSALHTDDLDEDRLRQPGARMLHDLIGVAEQPSSSSREWPTTESAPDHLLVDLAERLYRLGLDVVPNVGYKGGLRIPLAIGHPEVPGELLVAILTDDDEYLKQPSQRVRDRLLPEMLESQGWKVRRELSMGVFIDPNREAEAIVRLVLDAVDERREKPEDPEPTADEISFDVALTDELSSEGPVEETAVEDDSANIVIPAETEDAPDTDSEVEPEKDSDSVPQVPVERGPRPPIAPGLPLAAYGDDQLDEMAQWVLAVGDIDDDTAVEELRATLQIGRRGAQTDAVLRNVVKRCRRP